MAGWPRAPVRLKGLAVSTPTCSTRSRSELGARDPVTETVGNRSQSQTTFVPESQGHPWVWPGNPPIHLPFDLSHDQGHVLGEENETWGGGLESTRPSGRLRRLWTWVGCLERVGRAPERELGTRREFSGPGQERGHGGPAQTLSGLGRAGGGGPEPRGGEAGAEWGPRAAGWREDRNGPGGRKINGPLKLSSVRPARVLKHLARAAAAGTAEGAACPEAP